MDIIYDSKFDDRTVKWLNCIPRIWETIEDNHGSYIIENVRRNLEAREVYIDCSVKEKPTVIK